jgi:predicted TIM-barrel fold metal-dependent hydrolase
MGNMLTEAELARTEPAERAAFDSPVPTQVVSNGEYNPPPQTERQREVEARIKDLADRIAPRLGLDRRRFLRTGCGMAAAFLAMNGVHGPLFEVSEAEAAEPDRAAARAGALAGQFVFDDQLHFVRDDFQAEGLLDLRRYAAQHWVPEVFKGSAMTLQSFKFENFIKEVYLDSDTKIGLLSGAPFDDDSWLFLNNDQIARAREIVNRIAGTRRLLGHAVVTPRREGWLEEVDRCIAEVRPDSWKLYTIGDPLNPATSRFPYRLDDEALMYPFYERAVRSGITTVCVHKGLMPRDYETSVPNAWRFATVEDLPKAAKDWPGIRFVIYHAALRMFLESPDPELAEFERTGQIRWVSDLAAIPARHGVSNVYADLGTTFATCAVSSPRFAAAVLGTLVKGLGRDHVMWGTDAVWYGSPQWQIEAFRRLEIPADMQERHGFAPLGPADGAVKSAILGLNAARMYGINLRAEAPAIGQDRFALARAATLHEPLRSNLAYGYVARRA